MREAPGQRRFLHGRLGWEKKKYEVASFQEGRGAVSKEKYVENLPLPGMRWRRWQWPTAPAHRDCCCYFAATWQGVKMQPNYKLAYKISAGIISIGFVWFIFTIGLDISYKLK